MSIKENVAITVLNYNDFIVSLPTNIRTHILEPMNNGYPTRVSLTFSELQHINGQSSAIRSGLIRFEEEQEKEIYEALAIFDWKNILTNAQIKDIILHPTKDGLQKFVNIIDESVLLRVRNILTVLKNSGEYDISHRVIQVIDVRYAELQQKIFKSSIEIKAKDLPMTEDVSEVKKKNEILEDKLAKMQEMLDKLLENQNVQKSKVVIDEVDDTQSIKKPVGRPTTKK